MTVVRRLASAFESGGKPPQSKRGGVSCFELLRMSIVTAAAVCVVAWLAIAGLGGRVATARAGLLIAFALLPLPWFVSSNYPIRLAFAFAIGFMFTTAVDFAAGRRPEGFWRRVAYVIAFSVLIDPLTARPAARGFRADAARRILGVVVFAAVAATLFVAAKGFPAPIRSPSRILSFAALILATADLMTEMARLLSASFGTSFDPIHERPHRSTTLTEFWSRRWNRMGARWFRQHVFIPLRSTNVTLAMFALFAVSAAMHVYLIASVVRPSMMLACAAFFLMQPPLVLLERRLQVRRWPAAAGRLWTSGILIALLPLLLVALRIPL